ncbi:MAG: glycoside hydrolase family 5 protein, partial [Defluviitaleaceae bacterium]|nr:glycoside hydrolase family 5 protein [Defluviitaleaceae bacterium]
MKKIFIFVFSVAMMLGGNFVQAETHREIPPELSAQEVVARMGPGWNLGNTFDATARGENHGAGSRLDSHVFLIEDIETLWLGGRANVTTQTLIKKVKSAGFETLRVPVTWNKVADPENNWEIRRDWLERVREVVDWGLEEDMHVLINIHHDDEFLALEIENANESDHPGNIFVTAIWKQVAEYFRDYDDRLIFSSLNEPRFIGGANEWWGGTEIVR